MSEEKKERPLCVCSFCAKNETEITSMIAGLSVFICNECIELCVSITMTSNPTSVNRLFKALSDTMVDIIAEQQKWHERYPSPPPNPYEDEEQDSTANHQEGTPK